VGEVSRLPDADDGEAALRTAGLSPSPWSAGPGAVFSPHSHEWTKHLYVVRGTIDFDGTELAASQGIRIPAGTIHGAVAGPAGVSCVEAFED
jgi:quercetin dioxygenase-like cupin family protein